MNRPVSRRNGIKLITLSSLAVFLFPCCFFMVFLLFGSTVDRMTATPVSGTITDLYPVPTSQNGTMAYRVHLQIEDGEPEVFNLMASVAFGQLDVPTVYGRLHKGDRITATATGFKINGIGVYRNLVNPKVR